MLTFTSPGTPHVVGPGLKNGFDTDGVGHTEAETDGTDGGSTPPLGSDTDGVAVAVPVFVGDVDAEIDGAGDAPGERDDEGVTEMLGDTLAVTLKESDGDEEGDANRESDAVIDGDGVAVVVPVIVGVGGTEVASTSRAAKGTKTSLSTVLSKL